MSQDCLYSSLDARRLHNRTSSGTSKKIRPPTACSTPPSSSDVTFSPKKIKTNKTYKKKRRRFEENSSKEIRKKKTRILDSDEDQNSQKNNLETLNVDKLSKYNEIDSNLIDDDASDENDLNIINIQELKSPAKNQSISSSPQKLKTRIDGLIDLSDDEERKIPKKLDFLNQQSLSVDPTNILYSLQQNTQVLKKQVAAKYKNKKDIKLPNIIRLRSKLYKEAEKHFKVIPRILSAQEYPSVYYDLAKKEVSNSQHETMSNTDLKRIDFNKFCGGYYGFKRQSLIGSFILEKFKDELNSYKKNKVIQWWTKQNFATYVLANEIIIRMIQKDLNFTFDQAEKFCQSSYDYGSAVADTIDIEDDQVID